MSKNEKIGNIGNIVISDKDQKHEYLPDRLFRRLDNIRVRDTLDGDRQAILCLFIHE